ncbi:MAG: preprotein translocase subunit SecA [Patescibacteria group bacterium]|jgi:preprotein translocase subunit SecA
MSFLDKIYNPSKKVISQLQRQVDEINELEKVISKLTDAELKAKTVDFRKKIEERGAENEEQVIGETTAEAFAVLREAMKRVWGERHFDVQLIGGLVLHQGKIAEMKTGEGKTIVATLPLYLNALAGRGAHLVTVNDYLSKHQGEGMGEVFAFLGLTTGIIQSNQETYRFAKKQDYKHYSECEGLNLEPCSRKEAYACDITYGTNNEFGFDYLRDNMAPDIMSCAQRELHFAIVDEVDSILIDEARTPLIISAPAEESASLYQQFASLVPRLKETEDYIIDEKERTVTLTDKGIAEMEKMLHIKNIYEAGGITLVHHLEQALKAWALFKKDKDYVVREGEILIVDEFTGRLMVGRRYSEGLHQAIEAKENVEVKSESQTLATISFQNLFRIYHKLSGMTGTAATEAEEFYKIYKLDVVEIPTNKNVVRKDSPDRIYKSEDAKIDAIVAEVKERSAMGQPILIGTVSVQKNELISSKLKKAGVKHEVLNAKHHDREAKIIVRAGQKGAVTVATNMAGRGTDIKLGEGVREVGGLHVLGTERHEARRIDNQLRGRAGRQGDPGSSQFFVSMDDDLMRIFGGEKLKSLMNSLGLPDDVPVENKMISRSIESAQRRVEGFNFDSRKHLVEYDDVMNKHREVIYRKRRKILDTYASDRTSTMLKEEILEIINSEIERIFAQYFEEKESIGNELKAIFGDVKLPDLEADKIKEFAKNLYDEREKSYGLEVMRDIERVISLRTIDMLWIEHLTTMDELRTGIGLRGYGQRDPLVEYKHDAYQFFDGLLSNIDGSIAKTIYKVEVSKAQENPAPKPMSFQGPDESSIGSFEAEETSEARAKILEAERQDNVVAQKMMADQASCSSSVASVMGKSKSVFDRMKENSTNGPASQVRTGAKVGRNDLCPCGSGKKYKKCCGK